MKLATKDHTRKYAIILCGGSGTRLGKNKNKALVELEGKSILEYSLQTFQDCEDICRMVLVAKKQDRKEIEDIARGYHKILDIVEGGAKRQESSYNGLKALKGFAGCIDLVMFHNSCNPFITKKEIKELVTAARKYGAAAPGAAVKDTLKKIEKVRQDNNCIETIVKRTLSRHEVYAVQTPQTIRYELAVKAFHEARRDRFYGTDDLSLVERLGEKVKIVPCSAFNFKITTPEDYKIAQLIAKSMNDYENKDK